MIRFFAALTAVVFAVLLAVVFILPKVDHDKIVPTAATLDPAPQRVTGADANAAADLQSALRERTELQRWRADTGPSPGHPLEPVITGKLIQSEATVPPPADQVQSWLAQEKGDASLLRPGDFAKGEVNLPYKTAQVLMQPQGRDFRRLHNEEVTYGGGYVIFGMAFLLALFLALRGRIRVAEGFSGKSVLRFGGLERVNHWVTATSFVVMALTGLIILYGQYVLRPPMAPNAYGTLAEVSAYIHIAFAVPFVLGVAIMIALWIRQNLIKRIDLRWLARGGGFVSRKQDSPPAEKFNAGQKLIFWGVVLGSVLLLASGLSLVMPFFWLDIVGMQWAQVGHAAIGLLMIGLILAHIYIGTIGMQGAFDAMWSGKVDRNWAKEHHSLWFKKLRAAEGGER